MCLRNRIITWDSAVTHADVYSCWTESMRCLCKRRRSVLPIRRGQRGRPSWMERCVCDNYLQEIQSKTFFSQSPLFAESTDRTVFFSLSPCSVCLHLRVSLKVPHCSSPCAGPPTPPTAPPHLWLNLWPPATVRPTRTPDSAP